MSAGPISGMTELKASAWCQTELLVSPKQLLGGLCSESSCSGSPSAWSPPLAPGMSCHPRGIYKCLVRGGGLADVQKRSYELFSKLHGKTGVCCIEITF